MYSISFVAFSTKTDPNPNNSALNSQTHSHCDYLVIWNQSNFMIQTLFPLFLWCNDLFIIIPFYGSEAEVVINQIANYIDSNGKIEANDLVFAVAYARAGT